MRRVSVFHLEMQFHSLNFQQCSSGAWPLPGRRVGHGGVRDVAGVCALLQALLLLDAQDGAKQVEAGEATLMLFELHIQGDPSVR